MEEDLYSMKYIDLLKLIHLQLKEIKLTIDSPLQELSDHFKTDDGYRNELQRRLRNELNINSILSLYRNWLFDNLILDESNIDLVLGIKQEQAAEVNFGITVYNNISNGNYQTIEDAAQYFFKLYFKPSKDNKENQKQIDVILKKMATMYSKVMYIIALDELRHEFKQKKITHKILVEKNLMSSTIPKLKLEAEIEKIKWAGPIAELAKLFTTLARTGWIPDFQKDEKGPTTARAILSCFSVKDEGSNTDANYNTLQQALKLDSTGELLNESTNYYFGSIRKNPKTKK